MKICIQKGCSIDPEYIFVKGGRSMSLIRTLFMIMLVLSFTVGVYGCNKEGPAERAGEKMDNALEEAKKKFDEVTR